MSATTPVTAGGWKFADPPAGWQPLPNIGVRRDEAGKFPCSVVVVADELTAGEPLRDYINRQVSALKSQLEKAQFDGPKPATLAGAEEVLELVVRHAPPGGPALVQRQLYARRKQAVGVVTATATAAEWDALRPVFDGIIRGLKPA